MPLPILGKLIPVHHYAQVYKAFTVFSVKDLLMRFCGNMGKFVGSNCVVSGCH